MELEPRNFSEEEWRQWRGKLAAIAMQGLLASFPVISPFLPGSGATPYVPGADPTRADTQKGLAELSVAYADALLAALKRQ